MPPDSPLLTAQAIEAARVVPERDRTGDIVADSLRRFLAAQDRDALAEHLAATRFGYVPNAEILHDCRQMIGALLGEATNG